MFETKLETRWVEAIPKRCSVRKYTAAPTQEQLLQLGTLSRQLTWQGVRIMLLQGPGLKNAIKGTDVYAAIVATTKGTPVELEGYAGQAMALEATSMGLGTCWLGAGFYKSIVKIAAKVKPEEHVSCVLAIGQCAPQEPKPKRKPLQATSGLSDAQREALPAWQQAALQCAALAPSAINRQSWKFEVTPGGLLVQDAGGVLDFGYGPINCGIAMLHVALGAHSRGVQGTWKQAEKGWEFRAR